MKQIVVRRRESFLLSVPLIGDEAKENGKLGITATEDKRDGGKCDYVSVAGGHEAAQRALNTFANGPRTA